MNEGCPAYVKKVTITPSEAADLIRSAGGKAVLAHPVAYSYEDGLTEDDILELVKDMKVEAIEGNYLYVDRDDMMHDDTDKWNTVTGMTCAGSKDAQDKVVVTGICRDAAIWEPNENTHTAAAIKWYETTCKARKAATGENKSFSYETEEGKKECSALTEYITSNVVAKEIKETDYVDVYDGPYNKYTGSTGTLLKQVDTFTDTEKLKSGVDREEIFTLAPNSITKIRVYIWIEGQDIDNYDFASLGYSISVNFGFTKERITSGEIDEDMDLTDTPSGDVTDKIEQLPEAGA